MSDEYLDNMLTAIAVYSIAICIYGTIANLFSCYVCLRKNLRSTPTFVFYAFSLIGDTLALYVWNIDHYLLRFENYQLEDLGIHMCRFVTIIQCFGFQLSSWLLVTMTVERFVSVMNQRRKTSRKLLTKSLAICFTIVFILLILNIGLAIPVDYKTEQFKDLNITCFNAAAYRNWMQVNTYLYSLIPFGIMIVINILLLHRLFIMKNQKNLMSYERRRKRISISITIVSITTLFILLTAPEAVANGFYVPYLFETKANIVLLFNFDSIAFTFHSFNSSILFVSNKKFKKEFRIVFNSLFKRHNKAAPTLNHVTTTRNGTLAAPAKLTTTGLELTKII